MKDIGSILTTLGPTLPESFGSVGHVARPAGPPVGVVVCIGDLHGHAQVQGNTSKIIGHLVSTYGFRLVCVEGASGPGDTSELWSIPYRRRTQFCASLLERAYLTGSELATVSRPELGIELWGADSPSLYRAQWRAFKDNLASRPRLDVQLVDFRRRLRRMYSPLLSSELLRVLRLRGSASNAAELDNSFDEARLIRLFEIAERKNITLPAALWAALSRYRRITEERSRIGSEVLREAHRKVEESVVPLREVTAALEDRVRDAISMAYKWEAHLSTIDPSLRERVRNRYSFQAVLARLPADVRVDVLAADARFRRAWAAIPEPLRVAHETQQSISQDWGLSADDQDILWDAVACSCCSTEIDHIVRRLELDCSGVDRFVQLRFQPSEARRFIMRGQEAVCAELSTDIRRLNAIALTASRCQPLPLDPVVALRVAWSASETFYTVARQRSTTMARNIATQMRRRGLDRAIVTSGGFHSVDICDWLTQTELMATAIIYPWVEGSMVAAEDRYRKRGLEEE